MVIVNTIIGWLILLAMIIVLTNNNIPFIFPLINNLLGGFKHLFFSIIYGIILPIEYCMFQRGSNHQPGMVGCIFPDDFWDENMFFAGFFEGFARVLFFGAEDFEHVVVVIFVLVRRLFLGALSFLLRFDWFVLATCFISFKVIQCCVCCCFCLSSSGLFADVCFSWFDKVSTRILDGNEWFLGFPWFHQYDRRFRKNGFGEIRKDEHEK